MTDPLATFTTDTRPVLPSDPCRCSCADPCPLRKSGSLHRCSMAEVSAGLGCTVDRAPAELGRWQAGERARRSGEFRRSFPDGLRTTLVEADRPE